MRASFWHSMDRAKVGLRIGKESAGTRDTGLPFIASPNPVGSGGSADGPSSHRETARPSFVVARRGGYSSSPARASAAARASSAASSCLRFRA